MRSLLLLVSLMFFRLSAGNSFLSGQSFQNGFSSGSAAKKNYFFWHPGHPLQWEHFKGPVDSDDPVHGAVTYAGIDLQAEKHHPWSGYISFKAVAVFDKNLSWVKPDCKNEQLLSHEQLHFDIAELYARKLEKKLNSLRLTLKDKRKIKQLQQEYTRDQLEVQKKYDKETLHGLNSVKQKLWRKNISHQLGLPRRNSPPSSWQFVNLKP